MYRNPFIDPKVGDEFISNRNYIGSIFDGELAHNIIGLLPPFKITEVSEHYVETYTEGDISPHRMSKKHLQRLTLLYVVQSQPKENNWMINAF